MIRIDDLLEDEDGAPYPDYVQSAARQVARRMDGCALPDCLACDSAREDLERLIQAAVRAGQEVRE